MPIQMYGFWSYFLRLCAGSVLLTFLVFVTPALVRAQTYFPPTAIPYAAWPMTGTSLTGTFTPGADDGVSGPYPIGFPFRFFGNTYTQAWIGSNGWVSFSAGQPSTYTSAQIPSTAATVPRNCIMGPWQDWWSNLDGFGVIRYQTQGTAPNRRFVVSYVDLPMFQCTTQRGTFQIVLYECTQLIEVFIQRKPPCLSWAGGTAVLGLHNITGTAAVVVPGRNSTQWVVTPPSTEGWRFTPNPSFPPTPPTTVSRTVCNSFVWNGQTYTQSGVYTANLLNSRGCDSIVTVNLTVRRGDTTNLNATLCAPATYSIGSNVFSSTGNYSVLLRNRFNCDSLVRLSLTVNTLNASINALGSPALCLNDSVTLLANPSNGTSYQWYFNGVAMPGRTTSALVVATPGQYTVRIVGANGCVDTSAALSVTQSGLVASLASLGPSAICLGGQVTLSASPSGGGITTRWFRNGVLITGQSGSTLTTTDTGSYYVVVTTSSGCGDTSDVVLVRVLTSPAATLGPAGPIGICLGDSVNLTASPTSGVSYQWFFNGVLMTGQSSAVIRVGQPGFYRVRVANSGGCDDTSGSVELRVASTVQAGIAVVGPSVLCPGQPVTLQATPDTGASYQWFLNGAPLASTSSSIQVNQAGNYRVRVYTGSSCDDTTATISINPGAQPQALISALGPLTVCTGGVVNLFSTTPPPVSYQWLQDSLPMAGQNNPTLVASAPGLYRLIVTNPAGCADTSVELRVNWRTPPVVGLSTIGSVNLCIGDSVQLFAGSSSAVAFEWQRNGVTLAGITQSTVWVNQPGLYRVFVTDSFGCLGTSAPLEVFGDTSNPASLGLVGVPNLCSGIPAVLVAHPSGGTYTWLLNGQPLGGQTSDTLVTQQPGLYSVGVVRPSGCTDTSAQVSVAGGSVVQAVINGPSSLCLGDTVILSASPTATGVSYQWMRNGVVLTGQTAPILQTVQGGFYAVRVLNADGCFDTARIQLAERPTSTVVLTPQICRGDVFQVGSQAFNATGNYTVTLSNRFGCDSIIQIALTVSDTQRVQVAARICAPAIYVFGGQTLNSSGLYQAMFANASGCDSLVVVDLTVAQPSSLVQSISTCDSLVWGNRVLRNPGLFRDTTINAAGCDSISTLNLSLGFTKRDTVYRSACDSFLWDGQVLRQSGQYTRNYTQPTGCDSIVRLALDLGATVRDTLTQFSCDSFVWMGQVYRQSGTYLYQSQSAQGCDSLLTLQLTLANRSFTAEQIVVCDSLTWNGQTLTQSGTYTVVLPNAAGCDSVVSLALEVNQSYTITENITACDSFLWQGQTLRASGVYRIQATSVQGCDSSRVLNLIMGSSSTVVSAVQACGRYSWMGSNYIQSGLYWWRGTGSGGCDSAVGINLTILPIQREVYSVFSCDNYIFGSRLLSQGGTYRDTFVNTLGCDSIVTLNLSIDPTPQPPFPIDTNLCLVQGAQIPYSGPMTHELVWYAYSGDSVFLATGQRFNLIRNFDTLRVLISFRSPGGCLSPPALVRVINDDEPRFPVRPTAFTPNNDGRNDEWFVESTDVMTLLVFDRWGRLIHKDSGQTVRWNGGDYTPGTYPYILEKISCMGKVRSTHGLINLIK